MSMATIACVQLSLVEDEDANLAKCLQLIDEAAASRPDLIVLPEMANWSGGLIRGPEDALEHGAAVPGPFTEVIGERAARHGCYIAVGVIERLGAEAFIASVIVAPDRTIVLKYQKQIPWGGQRRWAAPGRAGNPVVDTPFGRIGIYICADGLIPETARILALKGAHLLLNTLHSGGPDETNLHVPARAAENRVWVASANKVGPREAGVLGSYCGGSQIVAPDGEIVARADDHSEMVIVGQADLRLAEDKRLWGDDLFELRRPGCYGAIAQPPLRLEAPKGPATLGVAALQPVGYGDEAVANVCDAWRHAITAGAKLVVMPGFFPFVPAEVRANVRAAALASRRYLAQLCAMAHSTCSWAVTSLVEQVGDQFYHTAYLLDPLGAVAATYRQVHVPSALADWALAGDSLQVFETSIGRIGLLIGADALLPESFRVLALQGAQIIAVAAQWRADYEVDYLLPERAAENRVNVVWARRFDSPAQRGSAIVGVVPYPSEPHWKVRSPDVVEAALSAPFIAWPVNLHAALDKTVGPAGCDLFASARPEEYGILTRPIDAGRRSDAL